MYSKPEESKWEDSLDVFEMNQIKFMKEVLKGKPGKIRMKIGTVKEMYCIELGAILSGLCKS